MFYAILKILKRIIIFSVLIKDCFRDVYFLGVSSGGTTSEYVRQELRAVVGARTGQNQPSTPRGAQAQLMNQSVTVPSDLEALGLSFEMPPSGKTFFCHIFVSISLFFFNTSLNIYNFCF